MLQIFSLPLTGKNKFGQLVVWKLLNFLDNDVFLTIPIWCQCTNGISIVKLWCNLQMIYLHIFYSLSWSQDQIMPQRGVDYNTWTWINLLWIWFGVLFLLLKSSIWHVRKYGLVLWVLTMLSVSMLQVYNNKIY